MGLRSRDNLGFRPYRDLGVWGVGSRVQGLGVGFGLWGLGLRLEDTAEEFLEQGLRASNPFFYPIHPYELPEWQPPSFWRSLNPELQTLIVHLVCSSFGDFPSRGGEYSRRGDFMLRKAWKAWEYSCLDLYEPASDLKSHHARKPEL